MLTTVATFTNPIEAHIVRGRLECEDVLAFVSHEHHIWAKWSISQALGGVKIQVASSNTQEALDIIADIRSGKYSDILEGPEIAERDYSCPKCKSSSIISVSWPWKLSLISSFLFFLPLPYTTKLVKCEECGFAWINKGERPYPLISLGIIIIALYVGMWLFVTSAFYFCKVNNLNDLCI